MFNKILIANRGEIACRIIRTARQLGITCVAVYSQADQDALHVKLADEAYCIGAAPARESYLCQETIIAVALKAKAEAIHPGYGFLSENPEFAEKCAETGIHFIGPPPTAIRAMGSKSAAKRIMEKAGVPLVPGYHAEAQDIQTLKNAAETVGYPILLKATAGGGGKGMRIVWESSEFEQALTAAKREALSSFGDDRVLLEKYLQKPRHIEIQVFGDKQGNFVYLFERDCSIQRRHQKIIEEAPAPQMTVALRKNMGEAAIKAAQAIGYVGAGTIEFLLDEDHSFYFMEMNTRLQVEHPVTEMITGQDLVEWQLKVAAGEHLPLRQDELTINGHAFETRIYAEDPYQDFLPSIGQIKYFKPPFQNSYVRLDTGVTQGDETTPYYDPMIAKLIVWGLDRKTALQHLKQALAEFQIAGITTNLDLLTAITRHPEFAACQLDTSFIPRLHHALMTKPNISSEILAIATSYLLLMQNKFDDFIKAEDKYSPWSTLKNWRLNLPIQQIFEFLIADQLVKITVVIDENQYQINFTDANFIITDTKINDELITLVINGQKIKANIFNDQAKLNILYAGQRYNLTYKQPDSINYEHATEIKSNLSAPMPGKIVALLGKAGEQLDKGAALAIVEAMKMEHTIYAPYKGTIKEWYFQIGDLVEEGTELLMFEEI
jgi:3-methylcrotonyl-CoA carboxylase alpha subunit